MLIQANQVQLTMIIKIITNDYEGIEEEYGCWDNFMLQVYTLSSVAGISSGKMFSPAATAAVTEDTWKRKILINKKKPNESCCPTIFIMWFLLSSCCVWTAGNLH